MGATCYYSGSLKTIERKAKNLHETTNAKIKYFEGEIKNFNSSKSDKKKDIINEINNSDDFNIEKNVSEFYKLQNQKSEATKILALLKHHIKDLKNLLDEIKTKSNIEQDDVERIKNDFEKIENKIKSLNLNETDNSSQKHSKKDLNSTNLKNINNLCELKNKLITEINNIKIKKENIKQKSQNRLENSLQISENELNSNNKQKKK